MSDPLVFTARSARFDLPFLFAAQAQKETGVNEGFARIDALMAPAIEGEAASPPASPAEGECWLVAQSPQGAWVGHEGALAFFCAGTWMFASPTAGMTVFDKPSGAIRRWINGWQHLDLPAAPSGGATIDAEARAAIALLIDGLRAAGIGV